MLLITCVDSSLQTRENHRTYLVVPLPGESEIWLHDLHHPERAMKLNGNTPNVLGMQLSGKEQQGRYCLYVACMWRQVRETNRRN